MKLLFSALFAAAALLAGITAEQCGHQAGGALCPGGLCCSRYGYCGTTHEYCGDGCQSQCSAAEQCGLQAGGALCPGGLCCSRYGYCGTTDEYCGDGCQSQCSAAEQCGLQAGGALCPGGLCCSRYGYCGTTDEYCGDGCQSQCSAAEQCGLQAGGALCSGGLCCSRYGYCGTTDEYCGDGCQSQCSAAEQCGLQAGGALCPGGLCCSRYGTCGTTDEYCGDGCQSQCSAAEQCGLQAGGALCPGGLCCSRYGTCGTTDEYCGDGCQSQCRGADVASIITRSLFDEMLKHRNDAACQGRGFYTYDAFITASNSFPQFGTTGDAATRKREIAAFLGQTSHETTGGWPTAPDGPYFWGYCFLTEQGNPPDYCVPSSQWPCASGKKYYGRGPIQLSYNYNYGPAGEAIGRDLLNNPDLVATDRVVSFKTALWFWMTPQSPKPSCHSVIIGQWTPSAADQAAGRLPGYGMITNIINGGLECGRGPVSQVANRIGFYKRYCDMLGVSYGDNLDCGNQRPFGSRSRLSMVAES